MRDQNKEYIEKIIKLQNDESRLKEAIWALKNEKENTEIIARNTSDLRIDALQFELDQTNQKLKKTKRALNDAWNRYNSTFGNSDQRTKRLVIKNEMLEKQLSV